MRRRDFTKVIVGTAAAWPFAVRAQNAAHLVIGYLSAAAVVPYTQKLTDAFRLGLKEADYIEGKNVRVEYRWANGEYHRLPVLASELVSRHVTVIVAAGGSPSAIAAKEATSTIPIVFILGADPVRLGLVASLSRPTSNVTGVAMLATTLEAKRLQLLREVIPFASSIAALINPRNPQATIQSGELQAAASASGLDLYIVHASTEKELETAFAMLTEKRAKALLVSADAFFATQAAAIGASASRHAIPTIGPRREYADAGGLMSYGTSVADAYRQAGLYVGRILAGSKPTDLPIQQVSRFELVVNLKTAKALRLEIPPKLLFTADEVIE